MKFKRSSILVVFGLFLVLCMFGTFTNVKADDSVSSGVRNGVDINKSWTVKFNKEIDKSTISESNFIVKDESGQTVPVSLTIGSDNKSVIVSPKVQYQYGKKYSLAINNIKSSSGKKLTQAEKMEFSTKSVNNTNNAYTVCIDAAHGGNDAGHVSASGVKEKDIDLAVALKLGKALENSGVKVVYTRTSDNVSWNSDNDLKSRFTIANNAKADYFISIRCNTYPENPSTKGIETYYRDSDNVAKQLAQSVQGELVSNTGFNNRGIKVGLPQHEILRGTNGSAIMVELGFMSNAEESSALATSDFQNKSANDIANAILKSLSLVSKNVTVKSVSDITASVNQGGAYDLPLNMTASMSDGNSKKVPVIWNSKKVDTSTAGSHTYEGTVAGYSKTVKLVLTVVAPTPVPIPTPVPTPDSGTIICIDPGHGRGKDTGASGINGLQEDDVTLSVGLRLGKILENHGIKVVYTRTQDERSIPMEVTTSLQQRCDVSNNANAKYFVAIHCNSFDSSSAYGTETLVNQDNPEATKLAQAIQNSIVNEIGTYDRGLKDGNWLYVVKHTNASAVLTELGFLTNPSDAAKLSSDEYRQKFAQAIADGILKCVGK
ncbi:N-acetylmuramoyl-L-alanine amidase [Clostridium carboxidivorans P7]|uniref:Cell wall hydrolase/autolysin n=1 Tax=Clostridium carboxidivorans P7 TaxID=536227 RepID=C6Q246_9CLOT|nr:N-acetylmuramoyl-L-alanine amidase [Clostridium carboxidivorans]AKN33233.1 N-acetylmuramoyl-L-alanine amidase [Clostridium carboxidivorans P7]EET84431.1 cell wall hydrolase/autolysin [Clostridium carboxidivorans P7]